MNKEKIEELAFKDRKELANLNELDLLEINVENVLIGIVKYLIE